MRPQDIENWAHLIIERVESKQPVEDSRVELKSEWPKDHNKAARQIAGHANAARGEPILWLLGIDEKQGVIGVNYEEISNWRQSVGAEFDGLSPTLTHINIHYKSKTVVALFWETEMRPFLVKTPKGGPISLEVPWRDAGSTRTANRMDLLKILSPVTKNPTFEVIRGELNISTGEQFWGHDICPTELSLNVYIVPTTDHRLVIPYHKCEARLRFIDSGLILDVDSVWFESGARSMGMIPLSSTIDCTASEIIITGPGMATIKTTRLSVSSEQKFLASGDVEVEVKMCPVGAETSIIIINNLKQTEAPKGALGRWTIRTSQANQQENELNLTKEEIKYLLIIADQEGRIYSNLLSAFTGRDTEIYREMLNKFVQMGLMREELDYWALTAKGYVVCENLRQENTPKSDKI
jgi:hypothetical protein